MGNFCEKCRKIKNTDFRAESAYHITGDGQTQQTGQNGQNRQNVQYGFNDDVIDGVENSARRAYLYKGKILNNDILLIEEIQLNSKTDHVIEGDKNNYGDTCKRQIFRCSITPQSRRAGFKTRSMSTGNFIDCRGNCDRQFMYVINEWTSWSHSICQIRFPNGTATGFRVGSKFIMTALHVVTIIDQKIGSAKYMDDHGNLVVKSLEHRNVFCLFDYIQKDLLTNNFLKFFLKSRVYFFDEQTDCVVLELARSSSGNQLPPPFELFCDQDLVTKFTLIGHNGAAMECNSVDQVIDKSSEITRDDIRIITDLSLQRMNLDYEFPPHNILSNEERILFHCTFSKGASGSPGIVVLADGRAVVVTMLLCGYPNWYYDTTLEDGVRSKWPQQYCIEQGTDMISVGLKIYHRTQDLYRDIFCRHLPDPSL